MPYRRIWRLRWPPAVDDDLLAVGGEEYQRLELDLHAWLRGPRLLRLRHTHHGERERQVGSTQICTCFRASSNATPQPRRHGLAGKELARTPQLVEEDPIVELVPPVFAYHPERAHV